MTIIALVRQGCNPTIREAAEATKMSFSGAKSRIDKLIERGYLERAGKGARSLRATPAGYEVFPELIVARTKTVVLVTTEALHPLQRPL